ncbi:MAG: hypothetical protein ACR2P1_05680 [Pseudomonadales bacterium]
MNEQQPQWQPISMLPVFTDMVDGMLASSVEQLSNMQLAVDKPNVLDDATLNRLIEQFDEQLRDHWLFEEQFARWRKGNLSDEEERELDRLIMQSSKLKDTNEEILRIAHNMEHATIDKIMELDDAELALAVLSGKVKPPG